MAYCRRSSCRLRFFLSDSRPLCWLALSADCCRELAPCACGLSMPSGGFEMAIPFVYNFRSVTARWTSSIVAILGIAGTVGVFVAMLSLARGFRATLVASGSPDDALVMRAGSTSEMMGGITLDSVKLVQDKPGVARDASGQPLVTQEVVGVIPIPLISTGTDAN